MVKQDCSKFQGSFKNGQWLSLAVKTLEPFLRELVLGYKFLQAQLSTFGRRTFQIRSYRFYNPIWYDKLTWWKNLHDITCLMLWNNKTQWKGVLSLWIVGGVKQDATPTKSLAILRWITIGIGNIRGTQQDAEPYQTVDDVMSHRMVQWKSLEGLGWIPNPTILLGAMFSSTRVFGSLKQ